MWGELQQTYKIVNQIQPQKASNKALLYSTSNKGVATVSKAGVIKAVSKGTAKITVLAKDGSGKKAVVTVNVKTEDIIKPAPSDNTEEATKPSPSDNTEETIKPDPVDDSEESTETKPIDPDKPNNLEEEKKSLENTLSCIEDLNYSDVDEEYNSMIKTARQVLSSSNDMEEIQKQNEILTDWLNEYHIELLSLTVNGDNLSDIEYDPNDVLKGEAIVTVTGYQDNCPELEFEVKDGSSFTVSDDPNYVKICVVTTTDGLSCRYKLLYETDDHVCAVGDVALNYEGENILTAWDEGEPLGDDCYVLELQGTEDIFIGDLEVIPENQKATVDIINSDKGGYSKKVVISYDHYSRIYYVRYSLDEDLACDISSVEAYLEDRNLITNWEKQYEESDDGYWVLSLYGEVESIPDTISYIPAYDAATVNITPSDKDGYVSKVTVTYEGTQRTYYVSYQADESFLLDIQDISSVVNNEEQIEDYDISEEDGYSVLSIRGRSLTLPDQLNITFNSNKTTGSMESSDKSPYEKKLIARYNNLEKIYYIEYTPDTDVLLGIEDITYEGSSGEYISGWTISEEDEKYIVEITGSTDKLPDNLKIVPETADAKVKYQASGISEYDGIITISYGDSERQYYIKYYISEDMLFDISNVSAPDDEDELVTYYETENIGEEEEYWVLSIRGKTDEIPEELNILPSDDKTTVELTTSDRSQYDKMALFKNGSRQRIYYIQYQMDEEYACAISEIEVIKDNENILSGYDMEELVVDDQAVIELQLVGKEIALDSNCVIKITPMYDDASVSIMDSDQNGYLKKAVITRNNINRTFYIKYGIDEELIFSIDDVEAIDNEENSIIRYDTGQIESGENLIWVLSLYGSEESLPSNCVITPSNQNTVVTEKKSDLPDYDKMFVMTFGEFSRTYYVSYDLDEDYVCDIDSVEAMLNEENLITDFETNYVQGEDSEDGIWVLHLIGSAESMPDSFIVHPVRGQSEVTVCNSDIDGYKYMVIIKGNKISRSYYVEYSMDEETMFAIDEVRCGDDSENPITDYSEEAHEDEEGNIDYWILNLKGINESIPSNIEVAFTYNKTTAQIDMSKKELTATCGNTKRVYKLAYELDMEYVCGIENIEAWNDETNVITDYNLEPKYKSEDGSFDYWILTITGTADSLPANLEVYAQYSEATVTIGNSGLSNYLKKIEISYNQNPAIKYKYYVKYVKE